MNRDGRNPLVHGTNGPAMAELGSNGVTERGGLLNGSAAQSHRDSMPPSLRVSLCVFAALLLVRTSAPAAR